MVILTSIVSMVVGIWNPGDYKWVTGVITPISRGIYILILIGGSGSPCRIAE